MNIASPKPTKTQHSQTGKVYFIADAHLGAESEPAEVRKLADLLDFLAYLEGRASTLVLLGDVFDFWFERPRTAPTDHPELLAALLRVSEAGTDIHFLGGNHDYWAGSKLERMTGARVHRQPTTTPTKTPPLPTPTEPGTAENTATLTPSDTPIPDDTTTPTSPGTQGPFQAVTDTSSVLPGMVTGLYATNDGSVWLISEQGFARGDETGWEFHERDLADGWGRAQMPSAWTTS